MGYILQLVSCRHHLKRNVCDGIGDEDRRIVMLEERDSRLCITYIRAALRSDRLTLYETKLFQFGPGRTNSKGGGLRAFILCRTYTTRQVGSARIMDMKWQEMTSATVKEGPSEFYGIWTDRRGPVDSSARDLCLRGTK